MSALVVIGAAAALGVASSAHCASMCGPLALATCSRRGAFDRRAFGAYFFGRIAGYVVAGSIAGAIAAPTTLSPAFRFVQLAIGVALGAVLVARGSERLRARSGAVVPAQQLVPRSRPWSERLARALPKSAGLLGAATAVFPCGALLGAFVAASLSGSAPLGALSMAVFAIASGPALLAPAWLARRFGRVSARRPRLQWASAVATILLGVWIAAVPVVATVRFARAADASRPPPCPYCHPR